MTKQIPSSDLLSVVDPDGAVSFGHKENVHMWGGSGVNPSTMVVLDTTTKETKVITRAKIPSRQEETFSMYPRH